RAAALHQLPVVSYIDDELVKHVDPSDHYPARVVYCPPGRYSLLSTELADLLLAFPGGGYALLNDIPAALSHGRDVVLIHDERLPGTEKSVFDGNERIANHVSLLIEEKARLTAIIRERLPHCCDLPESEIWDAHSPYAKEVGAILLGEGPNKRYENLAS